MQTRKRAKSVTFGKKSKEKSEKNEIKEAPKKEVRAEESEKTTEKAEVVERRPVSEKPQVDELSATLSEIKTESSSEENEAVATPTNEFISDNSSEVTSEKHEHEELSPTPVEIPESSPAPAHEESSKPIETSSPEPIQTPSTTQSAPSQDLSPTLPPSAFTIQNDETEISTKPEVEKKRFGVYFVVVAFLAFILGLGAMAAVSYFGIISLPLPKLSPLPNVHVPTTLLGVKPTSTPAPKPTVVPTATVTVNLQQYSIEVLNGSGVTGQAGKVKDSLTTDGFKVSSTGNAANTNFTNTEIAAKKSVSSAYLTKLEDELNKTLQVDTNVASLPDSSSTDVTVTTGSSTAQ